MGDVDIESALDERLVQDGIMRTLDPCRKFITMTGSDLASRVSAHSGNGHSEVEPRTNTFIAIMIETCVDRQLGYSYSMNERC